MADVNLTVGVDVNGSSKDFEKGVQNLLSEINNNKDSHKIKVSLDIDKTELENLQQKINELYSSLGKKASGGTTSASFKDMTTGANAASQGIDELTKTVTKYKKEGGNASSITKTYTNAITGATTAIKYSVRKNGELKFSNEKVTQSYNTQSQALKNQLSVATQTQSVLTNIQKLQSTATVAGITDREYETSDGSVKSFSTALEEAKNKAIDLESAFNTNGNFKSYSDGIIPVRTELVEMTRAMNDLGIASVSSTQNTKSGVDAMNAYHTAVTQGETALKNYSAAQSSQNQAASSSYSALSKAYEAMKSAATEYEKMCDAQKNGVATEEQLAASQQTLMEKTTAFNTQLKTSKAVFTETGTATKSLGDRLGGLTTKFTSWLTVSQIIMQAVRAVKQMVSASIELEDSMAQLEIVTQASSSDLNTFADNATSASQRVASSVTDYVDSATTYARLGYDLDESAELAEYTAMLQNVGDIETDEAQEAITSMIKAFDIDTPDIESVLDSLVTTGNNFPISVSEIATGMTNASSALSAAGNSYQESIALLTAANTTINLCRVA